MRTTHGIGAVAVEALLLHEELERAVAPAAGRDFEHAGLDAVVVENRPDGEALQEPAAGDVLGELLDRDARLDAPDIRLAQHELVEGNVARRAEGDLLGGFAISDSPRRAAESLSLGLLTRHEAQRRPLPLRAAPQNRRVRKGGRQEAGETRSERGLADVRLRGRAASSPAPPDRAGRPGAACRARPP